MEQLLSVDPGEMLGYALWEIATQKLLAYGSLPVPLPLKRRSILELKKLFQKGGPATVAPTARADRPRHLRPTVPFNVLLDTVVVEKFVPTPKAVTATLSINAVLRTLCEVHQIRYVEQMSSAGKMLLEEAKELAERPVDRHALDAIAHGLSYFARREA